MPVIRALPEEENRAREIIAKHSGKNWSLCDAISFAVLDVRGIAALSRSIVISFSTED